MRILLTGANGFIGSHIAAALIDYGHEVIAAVRDVAGTTRRLPGAAIVRTDFNRDTDAAVWVPRLSGVDAVINCAGILQQARGQSIAAIHTEAPQALFAACVEAQVRTVIQISAVSAEAEAGTAYASTKLAADRYLQTLDLDWIVLRPSLVYGQGSYGGTSLLRALAACPLFTPLPGSGNQPFQPIHVEDLARAIRDVLHNLKLRRIVLDPVGPETLSLKDIVALLRRWLGFRPVPGLAIPGWLIDVVARWGDLVGAGPINSTARRQLDYGNVSSPERFAQAIGFRPRSMAQWLALRPASVQDRWHARLALLRPVLRLALAFLWIGSGIAALTIAPSYFAGLMAPLREEATMSTRLAWAGAVLDLVIGFAVLARVRPHLVGWVQLAVVLAYTLGLTLLVPQLWLDPLGPLLKNVPILTAIMTLQAIENDR